MNSWVSIILAGGKSRRMGTSKALLVYRDRTMIQHFVDLLQPFSSRIVIVTNEQDEEQLKGIFHGDERLLIIRDVKKYSGEGPLAGMYSAMSLVSAEWYFVGACDMVFLCQGYLSGLQQMVGLNAQHDAYIPIDGEKYQPFAGLYRNQTAPIKTLLDQGQRRWTALLQKMDTYLIKEEKWRTWAESADPFFNMNHRQDYLDIINKER